MNHPAVSYCQGMSDLASPLLVTMSDEAHAYICFCALMRRLRPNFMLDGEAMTKRFQHLSDGLMFYDPDFYSYLKSHQVTNNELKSTNVCRGEVFDPESVRQGNCSTMSSVT